MDTGPLVALVNPNDSHHTACRSWFDALPSRRDLLIPAPVLAEICYLVNRFGGPASEAAFLDDLADGVYGSVIGVSPEDIRRMAQLVRQYASLPLGGTDACVAALAERVRASEIATVDRRHFAVVRPRHAEAFELVPAKL
jgi:uncharacterized protein